MGATCRRRGAPCRRGAYLDGLCIVGGLVSLLLIDLKQGVTDGDDAHSGSTDLDVALAIALLDDGRYEGG